MSKPDPSDPYLEGSHAKPKSNIAISPSQVTKPAKNDNNKIEKATARQPSRPSTSRDGTMISVGSPQWREPNCQLPDDENHLAWDDFQVVQKLKKKNNKKRKVDGPNLSVATDESTAPTPSYGLSIPMFAVVMSLIQKNNSSKGSHLSDDRNVCEKYKQRSQIVKIAQEKRIPVPIIANAMRKELIEDFSQIDDKVKILTKIIMDAAHKAIPKTSPNTWGPTGHKRIKNWWNELCSTAVEAKNIAKKAFQRHPSMSTAIEYKHSSAKVKKTCLQAKREAWVKFMTNVDHHTAVSNIHQYVSKMNSKRMTLDDCKYEIKYQGQLVTSDFLKADILANTFMKKPPDTALPNPPV
ncbi:hypothetical protein QYM36_010438 [Artemia franciscana]|uniref:Uncharacterized protein n=1 Tax=Artemia franciscana TaxID=6661 RepID=A0AA88L7W8_ARTSF|nr:hypothetical protein QYM36_010438 [Artemia franciscana]